MAAYTITLSVFPEGTGTVTGAGVYEERTSFTINAIPANGKIFDRWEMYYGGSWMNLGVPQEFTEQMPPQNIELRAVFVDYVPQYVTVTIDPLNCGIVNGTGEYSKGQTVTLQPQPSEGYMFRWWDFNGFNLRYTEGIVYRGPVHPVYCDEEDNPLIFTMPSGNVEITAVFLPIVEVWTPQDLDNVRNDLTGKYYKQMADIDLSGYTNWEPIGIGEDSNAFRAVYDFNGFTVSNLTINRSNTSYVGLFGYVEYDGIIKNARLKDPNIIGGYCTGALVGHHQREMLSKCIVTGGSVQCVDDLVGALFGWAVKVKECAAIDVDVSSTGSQYAGGLGGGLHSNFSNCYAFRGSVNGIKFIGGLIGLPTWISGSEFSYAAVAVSGTQYPGGLCGRRTIGDTAPTSAYYDTEVSGQTGDHGAGVPKTTAEMKTQATYEGWDFENVWAMDSSINDGYPCLQWQIPPPIEVWTAEDLNNVRNNLSGRYIQMADIDLSGYENWEPIGTYVDEQELEFRGIYDGNGHTIRHLKINLIDRELVGLFGATNNAAIKNLDLIDVDVSGGMNEDGDMAYGSIVGALAGLVFRNTNIVNCHSTGNVIGSIAAGGLAGQVLGSNISDCRSSASVTGGLAAGGLIGLGYGYDDPDIGNDYFYMSSCHYTGSVTSYLDREENFIGGLVGGIDMDYSRIFDCYSASTLLNGYYGGGLFGMAYLGRETEEYNVLNCYSICDISGGVASGGLIGMLGNIRGITFTICNCYSASSLSGTVAVGGLIAHFEAEGGESELENIIIISSYYDSNKVPEYEGVLHIDKGEPKSTSEMKTQSTYTDWDFTDVWGIDPAKNDGYPYLLWQQFDPPPEPFQPWTPPKLEPSWWEGFKLPFNVLELDEDAPIAIQRNFKEIEHYINFLGKASGEIKDSLELLATAPAPMSEEEMPDVEPETPPTDSYFAGYLLGKEGQMGSIDAAIKTDSLGGINEVWIARVIDKRAVVEIYNSDAPEHIFRTVAREFNLPLVNLGADAVDVAIEFDGTYDQYNIFVSESSPHIFWVERTANEDIIYTIKWDGADPAPVPTELARAQIGTGIALGLDPGITV